MILPIDDKYRIKSDKDCWKIQTNKGIDKKTGEINWVSNWYYTKLEGCVEGLSRLMLRTSDAQTLADALKENERILHVLSRALEPDYKIEVCDGKT